MKNVFRTAMAAVPMLLGLPVVVLAQAPSAHPHMAVPAAGPVRVENAWARANAGAHAASGAFLAVTAHGAADRLVGASSPVAGKVELHETRMEGTIMRMLPVAGIDLMPGKKVELKPGGLHIMLLGIKAPLKAGETFPLTLRFAHAAPVTVQAKVVPPGGSMPHGH